MVGSFVLLRQAKVCQSYVAVRVDEDVFRFKIAEKHLFLVYMFHSKHELGGNEASELLIKVLVCVELHR